jgi:predicted acyl esterase
VNDGLRLDADVFAPIADGRYPVIMAPGAYAKGLAYRNGYPHPCDVEIVPSGIVVPAGWTLALRARGKDYEYEGELADFARRFHHGTRGTGGTVIPPRS